MWKKRSSTQMTTTATTATCMKSTESTTTKTPSEYKRSHAILMVHGSVFLLHHICISTYFFFVLIVAWILKNTLKLQSFRVYGGYGGSVGGIEKSV